MFGGSGKGETRRTGGLSVIGADVTVIENVATDGDLHVDRTIEGGLSAETLTIEKGARLRGDSDYRTLQIENGAQVDGRRTHLQDSGQDTPLRLIDGE